MFTGLPAHVSALSGPAARTGIRPVPHRRPPWSSGDRGRESRCLSAAGIRLLGILSRRGFRPSRDRPTRLSRAWTPTGFPRSAHARHGRGGRPLYPEASGVHATGDGSPIAACRLFQRPGPTTRVFVPPVPGSALRGINRGSLAFARPAFPSPGRSPGRNGGPWASSSSSAPPQAGPVNARRGGDRSRTLIGNYAPNITGLQPASSLNMRDLASHPIRSRSARSAASR